MSPWAPLVCDRFLGFSCFYDFLSSAAQVFYRLSLSWDLSGAFLMIRGIGGFGEEELSMEIDQGSVSKHGLIDVLKKKKTLKQSQFRLSIFVFI